MAEIVQQAWNRYLLNLRIYPLRTKAATAAVLAGSSDLIAQKLAGAKKLQFKRSFLMLRRYLLSVSLSLANSMAEYPSILERNRNAGRGLQFALPLNEYGNPRSGAMVANLEIVPELLYGLLYGGPFGHYFHKLMEKLFPRRDTKTIVSKVIVEQLTSGPWNNFIFMTYLGLVIEGRPWSLVKSQLRTQYPVVQLNSWRFWPLVGLINYKYMPIHLRVLFHNLAAVCWGTFLILRAKASVPKLAAA